MFPSAYVSVRLCFRPPASMPACVSASLRLRPPVPLPVCVLASLCFRPPVPLPVCVPASLHPQHCSASSLISPIFIQLIRFFCSSRLSCSFLFSLILSFHSSSSSSSSFSLLLFFSSSLIFSLPIPILLTLLVLPATHLFLSKSLYREQNLRNCDVPHAAIHPFELKTLYREQIPGH